jgi:predicted Zn-dependent peptidase
MLGLAFNEKKFETQRGVVIEEFKQRYLNQPYGDVWLKLRPLAFQQHPYQWNTIGKEVSHIEEATLDEVKAFFKKFYTPNNAILVVGGNTTLEEVKRLSEKWFAPIPAGEANIRNLPTEPIQTQARSLETTAKVPLSAIYKAYHMAGKGKEGFFETDLVSDILGRGKSSRLYQQWVREKPLFNQAGAYITASFDPGLLVVYGMLNEGVSMQEAEQAIESTIAELQKMLIDEDELTKVKNKAEASIAFEEVELLTRARSLAYGAVMGNPDYLNEETAKLQAVTPEGIHEWANKVLKPENCSTLYYHKQN